MSSLFNAEPELAVLNILMTNPEKYYELSGIKDFMFSSTPNQVLFGTIDELHQQGITPEYNLIKNYLDSHSRLDKCGGIEYLNFIASKTYDAVNIRQFEKLVIDAYKARSLISLSSKVSTAVTDGEDIDTLLSQYKNNLDNLSTTAFGGGTESVSSAVISTYNDIAKKVEAGGQIPGISTGYFSLDTIWGGHVPGRVNVVAGRPAMGKSLMMCNFLLRTPIDCPTLVFSLEMSKQSLIERMLAILTGIETTNISFGLLNQQQLDLVYEQAKELKKRPIYIDTNYTGDINYTINTVKKYVKHFGVKRVEYDYIQLGSERDSEATHELGRMMRNFKLSSNDLGISYTIYSQLNRGVEMREDKRPVLSDLRQSGNIEEDGDTVSFIYRDVVYNKKTEHPNGMEFIVRKNRHGKIGTILFDVDLTCGKVKEINA